MGTVREKFRVIECTTSSAEQTLIVGDHKATNVESCEFLNGIVNCGIFVDSVVNGAVSTDRPGVFGCQSIVNCHESARSDTLWGFSKEGGWPKNGPAERGGRSSAEHGYQERGQGRGQVFLCERGRSFPSTPEYYSFFVSLPPGCFFQLRSEIRERIFWGTTSHEKNKKSSDDDVSNKITPCP